MASPARFLIIFNSRSEESDSEADDLTERDHFCFMSDVCTLGHILPAMQEQSLHVNR